MTRNRTSARKAGSSFERAIADALAAALDDDRIDRRVKTGAKDRGDIGGVRIHGHRLVVECKNVVHVDMPGAVREAQAAAGHDDALAGIVIHKRHGVADPMQQWVTCTVAELVSLILGYPYTDPPEAA